MSTLTLPPAPPAPAHEIRYLAVRANLLPTEVVDARRGRQVRQLVLAAVAAVAVLMAGWTALSKAETSSAHTQLDSAQARGVSLIAQQARFGPLVTAQSEASEIKTQLSTLMTGDLSWSKLLTAVRAAAPPTIGLKSIAGLAGSDATGPIPPGISALNASGSGSIGTISISGTTPDHATVARYLDTLNSVPGLTVPYPATVIGVNGAFTFSATCVVTAKALGGRFTTTATGSH
ncbi:MAG TPA: hypothetical protein VK816_04755 [Jatrophihabitantaceae bacterium]|jgi:Tfp pilus assembly protein PilN|nr:hypothetical protein [Jatrophihabitantaceae bacterium]